ncbi:MAG: HD domain-containing protein [Acidobacteriaceae bacterium]|nr:HD domain-containing protein [Acidobacteriaceae bacterium]
MDEIVRAAFERTNPRVTVVAVGGYGRRELFPCSDVDLLLLATVLPANDEKAAIAEFVRLLWDSDLRISQSVHTPAECCEIHDGNLELTISLLDQRFLCGDERRYQELSRLFPRFLNAERDNIILHLGKMTRGRHSKYGDTIYHLEPNVKEHPGGLRDLHVIHWLHKLREYEVEPLEEPRAFLFDVRTRLHEHYKRDNNLLSFEAQELLSRSPEQWMREYYRNVRQIDRAIQQALDIAESKHSGLIEQFRDWRSRLSNTEFTVSRGQVLLRNPAQLESDPGLIIRLMHFVARHQLALAHDTERRLRNSPAALNSWPDWKALLALPRCVNALRMMAALGVLQQMIPEWSRIDCLVVRDFYHRYTVDEHTLMALQSLEQLAGSNEPGAKNFANLLAEVDRADLLRFALLLHDIGKGEGTGEHTARSADIAGQILERLRVPDEDKKTILFLIAHHIDLSKVMTSRDLMEPSTARQIAELTETTEQLKLLTLLTYADISAVNPTAMTPWRREQLWKVYSTGHARFTRELETERIHFAAETSADAAEFLEGLPTRYLKTHTPGEIAGHIEMAKRGNAVQLAKVDGSYRLTVVAKDRPGLLAAISGGLSSFGMNILKAEAFGNARGEAVDTFIFEDPHRTLELNPEELDGLQETILRAVTGKVDVSKLMEKRRHRPGVARIDPTVAPANDVSDTCTLFQIVAEDRPGLLYDLTRTFASAGANIEVVLIDTEAHRALDVFYVRQNGEKLTEEQMIALSGKLLEVCRST